MFQPPFNLSPWIFIPYLFSNVGLLFIGYIINVILYCSHFALHPPPLKCLFFFALQTFETLGSFDSPCPAFPVYGVLQFLEFVNRSYVCFYPVQPPLSAPYTWLFSGQVPDHHIFNHFSISSSHMSNGPPFKCFSL